jgi:hypothetical protein
VAPEAAGSSPAGLPPRPSGRSGDQQGPIRLAGGFDPRSRHHLGRWRNWKRSSFARRRLRVRLPHGPHRTVHPADVAQRERHGAQTAASVGSNPTVSTAMLTPANENTRLRVSPTLTRARREHPPGRGAMGGAPASEAGGWRFEPSRPDHAPPQAAHQCEVVELVPRLALNQEVRVRTVASQLPGDASAVVTAPRIALGTGRAGSGTFDVMRRFTAAAMAQRSSDRRSSRRHGEAGRPPWATGQPIWTTGCPTSDTAEAGSRGRL